MKILKPVLFFVIIVIIGVGIGWLAGRRGALPTTSTSGSTASSSDQNQAATTSTGPGPIGMSVQSQNTNMVAISSDTADATEESTNLDDKVADIIGEDTDVTNIVTDLVTLYPKLSDDGKVEATEHLINLVPDDDYGPLANILTNGTVTPAVASRVLGDLVDRPNEVKMPLMLAVARDPNNPGAKEALENLQLLVDPEEDPGNDWDKWQKDIDAWMKDNPD